MYIRIRYRSQAEPGVLESLHDDGTVQKPGHIGVAFKLSFL